MLNDDFWNSSHVRQATLNWLGSATEEIPRIKPWQLFQAEVLKYRTTNDFPNFRFALYGFVDLLRTFRADLEARYGATSWPAAEKTIREQFRVSDWIRVLGDLTLADRDDSVDSLVRISRQGLRCRQPDGRYRTKRYRDCGIEILVTLSRRIEVVLHEFPPGQKSSPDTAPFQTTGDTAAPTVIRLVRLRLKDDGVLKVESRLVGPNKKIAGDITRPQLIALLCELASEAYQGKWNSWDYALWEAITKTAKATTATRKSHRFLRSTKADGRCNGVNDRVKKAIQEANDELDRILGKCPGPGRWVVRSQKNVRHKAYGLSDAVAWKWEDLLDDQPCIARDPQLIARTQARSYTEEDQ